jgi:hypothetical protein
MAASQLSSLQREMCRFYLTCQINKRGDFTRIVVAAINSNCAQRMAQNEQQQIKLRNFSRRCFTEIVEWLTESRTRRVPAKTTPGSKTISDAGSYNG